MFKYNFPEIKLPNDHSIKDQIFKIEEETDEVMLEIYSNDDEKTLEESIDVLLTTETLHRVLVKTYGKDKVDSAIEKTITKNQLRNYFVV